MAVACSELLAELSFTGTAIEWRGPAPHVFVPIPSDLTGEIRYAARAASYGWGVLPVQGRICATDFATSLFPRNGTYYVPVKKAVQRAEAITLGDRIAVLVG